MRILIIISIMTLSLISCNENPDSEGMHWDYSIVCEGYFKYKVIGNRAGVIPMLNSDGTPLRCNKKRY